MSRHDHDLLRMFTPFEIGNNVIADGVGKLLRSEREMHADFSLSGEMRDEVGIFGSHSAGRDAGEHAETGMRQAVIRIADGAHKSGAGSQIGGGTGSSRAIANRFAVGNESKSGGGFLFVEDFVEQNNLAGD